MVCFFNHCFFFFCVIIVVSVYLCSCIFALLVMDKSGFQRASSDNCVALERCFYSLMGGLNFYQLNFFMAGFGTMANVL